MSGAMPPKVQDMPPGGPSAHPAASTPNGPKHKYSNAEKRAYRKSLGLPKKKSKAAKAKAKRAEAKANAKTRRDEWARLTPDEKQVKREASETAFYAKHIHWTQGQWNRRQEKNDKWRAQQTRKFEERQAKRDLAQAERESGYHHATPEEDIPLPQRHSRRIVPPEDPTAYTTDPEKGFGMDSPYRGVPSEYAIA